MPETSASTAGGRAVFAYPAFRNYELARFLIVVSLEMQSVAVGWQVYDITRQAFALGVTGLVQFLPGVLLFLIAGHAADVIHRRRLLTTCYAGFALCSALLLALSIHGEPRVFSIYVVMTLVGVVRSFSAPVTRAILPQLVPMEIFPSAVAWHSSVYQTASILGPAVGGLIYAAYRGPEAVYATALVAAVIAGVVTLRIEMMDRIASRGPVSWNTVFAGLRYIWREKVILGSISLDLVAVLLGGAVALLPIYAREILRTGPWGLGILRSAPGVGAAVMAIFLGFRPLRRRAGVAMLWCVAGFGAATIIFGLSRSLIVSVLSLVLVGATDMVSVVIRGTLVQVNTPDEMRGRVNAVDMVFIGASNELGEFESGLIAQWLGAVPAVIIGGVGAIIATALWAWWFPALRRADKLVETAPAKNP
ncbi:MAG TPA: MFS transporter [Candidatus Acidoferrales bacterium]|nr:MFS transporter [Candidatus Acidoferrales bacterium]